jgi:hypothetical protein
MKLFEHPDFEQTIIRAAEHFQDQGLRPAIIEKDYYVTESLRIIAHTAGDKVLFKGGTSLSKGWNLIQRFSEDIDLFLDPLAFKPPLGKNAIDRELKKLRDAIASYSALTFMPKESQTVGGLPRLRCWMVLGLNCGFGQQDIADLRCNEVDWDNGYIERERSKTKVNLLALGAKVAGQGEGLADAGIFVGASP